MEWFNGTIQRNDSTEWFNGTIQQNDSTEWFNGTIQRNDLMEWFNGMIQWNDSMDGNLCENSPPPTPRVIPSNKKFEQDDAHGPPVDRFGIT